MDPAATTIASRTRVTITRRLGSLARIENSDSGHSPNPETETTSISTAGDEQQYSVMRNTLLESPLSQQDRLLGRVFEL